MNNLTLESRIDRLEKLLNGSRRKNEDDRERRNLVNACKTLYKSLNYLNDIYSGDNELYNMMNLFTAFCDNHDITEKDLGLL